MEEDDLVAVAPAPDDETDERRRYYRITDFGAAVAAAELERMRSVVAAGVEARLLTVGRGRAG
jgi:DNA-binding PadR family transcriptional regulator